MFIGGNVYNNLFIFDIVYYMFLFSSTSSWKKHSSQPFISDVSATFKVIEWLGPPSLNSFLFCLACCFLQQEDLQYGSGFFLLLFHHSSGLVFSENKKRLYLSKKEITTSPIGIYPISLDSIHSSSITWYYTTIPKFKNKSPILALCHHYSRRCPLWCRNLFKICLCILASIRKNGSISIRAGSRGIAWPWWNSLLPSNNIISLPEGASLPWRLKNHLSEVQTNRDHSWIKMKMCRNGGHPPRAARAYL